MISGCADIPWPIYRRVTRILGLGFSERFRLRKFGKNLLEIRSSGVFRRCLFFPFLVQSERCEEETPQAEQQKVMQHDSQARTTGPEGTVSSLPSMTDVWLYEHTKLQLVVDDITCPRICRWSSTLSYNVKACSMHFRNLRIEDQVRAKFAGITPAEIELLGEEEDSNFELVKEKKPKTKGKKKVVRLELDVEEKLDEERLSRKEKSNRENVLLRRIRRGKEEMVRVSEDLKDMEARLQTTIKEIGTEVRSLRVFCESLVKQPSATAAPSRTLSPTPSPKSTPKQSLKPSPKSTPKQSPKPSPKSTPKRSPKPSPKLSAIMASLDTTPLSTLEVTLVDPTPSSSPRSLIKNVKQRANRKRKVPGTPKKRHSDKCGVLPGDHTIFNSGNVLLNRALIDDLLGERWLSDMHINTWALVLSAQRRRSSAQFKSFLYISPDYTYFKRSKCSNSETMINHVTPENVSKANILLMPVHTVGHWSLLVCDMKYRKWDFYDSMPRSVHRASLPTLVSTFYKDARKALPSYMLTWKIGSVDKIPKQQGGTDCGVFVLKYM
ncbi:hypothetical protein KSP39_PZI003001 [Platanthera zijinensis]|uniref:Ubiquitin-like protease family profile domain-containing protein n=1 Tax=Platanthera zijinensis TaxID=2320716 RepID=A0AAP0GDD4_9ASPA